MRSFFAALAGCGLGLSLNTPIGVAAEWEPVNTDPESKSTTSNQVYNGRSKDVRAVCLRRNTPFIISSRY